MKTLNFLFSRRTGFCGAPPRFLALGCRMNHRTLLAPTARADRLGESVRDGVPHGLPRRIGISLWQTHSWTKVIGGKPRWKVEG
jgi:hypothetical protein